MKKTKKRQIGLPSLILTVLYILVMFFITFINSPMGSKAGMVSFGIVKLPASAIAGCLNAILLILVALITIVSNGKNWIRAIILQGLQLIIVLFSIFKLKNSTSIPGAVMILFGIILIFILKTYIKKIISNESELDRLSFSDTLTGLPNRRALMRKMNLLQLQKKSFYLVFLDLDNFKIINDTLGHDKGDELLQYVSSKWSELENVTPNYHLYRLGGDEFAIIIDIDNEVLIYDICSYAVSCLTENTNDFSGIVTCSAGYAKFPDDTKSIFDLLTYADTAMYKAKTAGKNQIKKFDKNMFNELVKRFNIETDLKDNLADGLINLVYQPQQNLQTNEQYGWEILSRMNDKFGQNVSPAEFINTAEKSTLIYEIDNYVLKNALSQTSDYYAKGGTKHISVNISGKHVSSPNFIGDMYKIFKMFPDFPYEKLTIEITESSYVKNIETAQRVLTQLKENGCKIALDDFGTGYSSLCYLSKLPIDYIKIDKSFIDNLIQDDMLVKIIIQLGHMLGLKIIAEGVETEEQLKKLKEFNCDFIQGYILGTSKLWKDI